MKIILMLLLGLAVLNVSGLQAADLLPSERDCAEILEQWAEDPESVPQHLVDECQAAAMTAAGDDVPALAPMAGGATVDPCAGADASGSAFCWGPWSAVLPAAGNAGPPLALDVEDYETRPELAQQFDPVIIGTCEPGLPCGFATVVAGTGSQAPADQTTFARFDMADDGSSFVVDPGQPGEIASVGNMSTTFVGRPDEFENMRATGAAGDEVSRLVARVIRDGDGNITAAADVWGHANRATGSANSGFFAWGTAMSGSELTALNNAGVAVNYTGPMSVDNNTIGSITVNFGTQPDWSGAWTNPAYQFDAGGTVVGADLVSDAGRFSSNVGSNSTVQGALIGTPGDRSVVHIIDVDITGVGRIKDVGLLRE